jgi:hypothetical protein
VCLASAERESDSDAGSVDRSLKMATRLQNICLSWIVGFTQNPTLSPPPASLALPSFDGWRLLHCVVTTGKSWSDAVALDLVAQSDYFISDALVA